MNDVLDPADNSRARGILFWLIALALLGSLLTWAVLHAPPDVAMPKTDNSALFTEKGDCFSNIHAVNALLTNPRVVHRLLPALFAILVGIYIIALVVVARRGIQASPGGILLATLLISAPLLALPRLLSSDVYLYAMYGRMISVYGANPYFHTPAEFSGDTVLQHVLWSNLKSVYGPIWLMISLPITWLARAMGGSAGAHVLAFKLAGLAFHLL